VAGLSALTFPRFAAWTYSGGLLWTLSYLLLGYLFEEKWSGNLLQMHHWLILGSVALSMGLAYKLLRKRAAGIWGHGD